MSEPVCAACPARIGWTAVIRGRTLCGECSLELARIAAGVELVHRAEPISVRDWIGWAT